ncbi:MAG: methyltransferase domain-containing protein [Candidatus Hydrogenedentes bacterium]|nr:methyltransferase domain-containing protein [Candidatus Hydrogenedentota bacterium]
MSFHGADWLERAGRDEEQQPEKVMAIMGLQAGDAVADIGSGSGYFARHMAKVVGPEGKVYGQDIQPEMLEILKQKAAAENITNIETVLGVEDDPKLPPLSLDWVILVDVYHEFQQPQPMLAKIRDCLKPAGKVALIEYRLVGETAKHIRAEHRMSVSQVLKEWSPAGFELVELHEFLSTQHLFILGKDEG